MSTQDLSGQFALVTGAGSGIGQAVALEIAARGASLVLLGRDVARLTKLFGVIAAKGTTVVTIPCDLEQAHDVRRAAGDFATRSNRLDILIHSAGIIDLAPLATASLEMFDAQWAVNVRAPYLLTQALLPQLQAVNGQVVFINSTITAQGSAGRVQYAATKAALRAVADGVRVEVNASGIRVLSVYPGRAATPMQQRVFEAEGRSYDGTRLLQPADVARVVVDALRAPRGSEVTDLHLRSMVKP